MTPARITKAVKIVGAPCGNAMTNKNWEQVRKVAQEVINQGDQITNLGDEINEVLTIINNIIEGDTVINNTYIYQTTYGASGGRIIHFKLNEDKPGATAPATVLATFNGEAPDSPVTVQDLILRWPDAMEDALGLAQEVYSGTEVQWLIFECQQLVRFGTAHVREDNCGDPGPTPIDNFESIPDGEYVQEPKDPPATAANPKNYAFEAGTEVSLRRVGDVWQIESVGLVDVEQLQDVYMAGMSLMKVVGTVKGIACAGGSGSQRVVFTAAPCT